MTTNDLSTSNVATNQSSSKLHDDEVNNAAAVLWTTGLCAVTLASAHIILGVNYWLELRDGTQDPSELTWEPVVGLALGLVGIFAFGGFYVAARRARVGIGAAFILTFLAMLSFALTIPAMSGYAATEFVKQLVEQFTAVVSTVVAFYFGTEAVISGLKIWKTAEAAGSSQEIKRADLDLGTPTPR